MGSGNAVKVSGYTVLNKPVEKGSGLLENARKRTASFVALWC